MLRRRSGSISLFMILTLIAPLGAPTAASAQGRGIVTSIHGLEGVQIDAWTQMLLEGVGSGKTTAELRADLVKILNTVSNDQELFKSIYESVKSTRLQNAEEYYNLQGENFDAAANRGIFGLENGKLAAIKPSGKRPIVILLPGIMGSFLEMGDKPVWINYLRFTTGGLTKLTVSDQDKVKATGVIKTAYKDLVEYLAADYDVVVFPFDWRRPLSLAGKKLAEDLEEYCKEFSVSISLVGHSMGGLVIGI